MKPTISFLEFFSSKDFAVPIWEVVLLIIINSVCLLFGKHKFGLLVSYFFVFYWGFVLNRGYFTDVLGNITWGLYVYSISGIMMATIIIISFFVKSE